VHTVDSDEIDVELRSPAEARSRILVLSAIFRRLALENALLDEEDDPLADVFDEREWLRDQDLAMHLTAWEAALLDRPLGSIAPEVIMGASWQGEALVALAWAIGAVEMPPIDAMSDPRRIMELVPRPWDTIKPWISDSTIISESEAVQARELAEIWHWRATSELLRREAPPAHRQEFESAIREVAVEALNVGIVPALCDSDFPVRGRSIKELSDTDVDELVSATSQRLRALNWLCGFGHSWDDVPLDV
jgi:hypothetical protein